MPHYYHQTTMVTMILKTAYADICMSHLAGSVRKNSMAFVACSSLRSLQL